jgi:flavodoxin
MKTLIAFYSRSGSTKKVAEKISQRIRADIDEIIDLKDRSGIIGWFGGGKDVFFKKSTTIKNKLNPEKYDLVIIGTPIWVGTMTPAVKAYFKKYDLKKCKKLAFYCTAGDKQATAFKEMQEASKKPIATMDLKGWKVKNNLSGVDEEINKFCGKLK